MAVEQDVPGADEAEKLGRPSAAFDVKNRQLTSRATARVAGLTAGVLAFLLYLPGISRAFDHDGALTVVAFVRTPSLLDPFRRQIVYNNHVAFSFLEHSVYSLTGASNEWVMRLLPISFAAITVGIVVTRITTLRGRFTGVLSGLLLVTSPLFLEEAREVRGYSLLVLCATASTFLLADIEQSEATRRRTVGYVALLALGIATHLYMILVVVGHMVFVWARHNLSRAWWDRWIASLVIGGIAYAGVFRVMTASKEHRSFQPDFPLTLSRNLLGYELGAVAIVGFGVAITVWSVRQRRETKALALLYTLAIAGIWVVGPANLYPRFFVWATPAVAIAAAIGLARLRLGFLLGVVAALLALLPVVGTYTQDAYAYRSAAEFVTAHRSPGERVCSIGWESEALPAYLDISVVVKPSELQTCRFVVDLNAKDRPDLLAAARHRFAKQRRFVATTPGYVLWDKRT